jgi:hypothetical protein
MFFNVFPTLNVIQFQVNFMLFMNINGMLFYIKCNTICTIIMCEKYLLDMLMKNDNMTSQYLQTY